MAIALATATFALGTKVPGRVGFASQIWIAKTTNPFCCKALKCRTDRGVIAGVENKEPVHLHWPHIVAKLNEFAVQSFDARLKARIGDSRVDSQQMFGVHGVYDNLFQPQGG